VGAAQVSTFLCLRQRNILWWNLSNEIWCSICDDWNHQTRECTRSCTNNVHICHDLQLFEPCLQWCSKAAFSMRRTCPRPLVFALLMEVAPIVCQAAMWRQVCTVIDDQCTAAMTDYLRRALTQSDALLSLPRFAADNVRRSAFRGTHLSLSCLAEQVRDLASQGYRRCTAGEVDFSVKPPVDPAARQRYTDGWSWSQHRSRRRQSSEAGVRRVPTAVAGPTSDRRGHKKRTCSVFTSAARLCGHMAAWLQRQHLLENDWCCRHAFGSLIIPGGAASSHFAKQRVICAGEWAAVPDSHRVQLAVGKATTAERPGRAGGRHRAGCSAFKQPEHGKPRRSCRGRGQGAERAE